MVRQYTWIPQKERAKQAKYNAQNKDNVSPGTIAQAWSRKVVQQPAHLDDYGEGSIHCGVFASSNLLAKPTD